MIRTAKLRATPITEETFIRQGWKKYLAEDFNSVDDVYENMDDEADDDDEGPFFYTLPLPKGTLAKYAPMLVTNATDEVEELEALGLKPNQFFIEMLDTQGLGFCATEEELEILYRALTSKYIEE
jgi:hypothetical protein|tara:strand:- start:182 stop:556 length:375 start_codon:yes stop_codon:yes gene_type:complete